MAMWEGSTASTGHVFAHYCSTSCLLGLAGGDRVSELRCLAVQGREDHLMKCDSV